VQFGTFKMNVAKTPDRQIIKEADINF
jgi:hypothetical protein